MDLQFVLVCWLHVHIMIVMKCFLGLFSIHFFFLLPRGPGSFSGVTRGARGLPSQGLSRGAARGVAPRGGMRPPAPPPAPAPIPAESYDDYVSTFSRITANTSGGLCFSPDAHGEILSETRIKILSCWGHVCWVSDKPEIGTKHSKQDIKR